MNQKKTQDKDIPPPYKEQQRNPRAQMDTQYSIEGFRGVGVELEIALARSLCWILLE